jgi:hypothetical protein
MPEERNQTTNSQTLVVEANDFDFDAIEQQNGVATVVKFKLENPAVRVGDVLLVLAGDEIHFHGLIGKVEDGYAMAMDRNGSLLPALVN